MRFISDHTVIAYATIYKKNFGKIIMKHKSSVKRVFIVRQLYLKITILFFTFSYHSLLVYLHCTQFVLYFCDQFQQRESFDHLQLVRAKSSKSYNCNVHFCRMCVTTARRLTGAMHVEMLARGATFNNFCRAMLCISAARPMQSCGVSVCVSVCHVRELCQNK